MRTLEEVREAVDASILSVPLHRHLGISIDRSATGEARILVPARPEIMGPEGHHSPASIYVAADVASAVCVCDEIAPLAVEMQMGAFFLTVSASFEPGAPSGGTLEAAAEMTRGFDAARSSDRPLKKGTLDVTAGVGAEGGAPTGEQRARFYVRFMEPSRMREIAPESSEIVRILGA